MSYIDHIAIGSDTYDIKDSKAGSYSESETDTGMTWINGKTIYRKVLDVGAKASGTYSANTGITGMTQAVTIRMIGLNGNNWYPIPYPYDATHMGSIYCPGTSVSYVIPFDSSATYIILEYTK